MIARIAGKLVGGNGRQILAAEQSKKALGCFARQWLIQRKPQSETGKARYRNSRQRQIEPVLQRFEQPRDDRPVARAMKLQPQGANLALRVAQADAGSRPALQGVEHGFAGQISPPGRHALALLPGQKIQTLQFDNQSIHGWLVRSGYQEAIAVDSHFVQISQGKHSQTRTCST